MLLAQMGDSGKFGRVGDRVSARMQTRKPLDRIIEEIEDPMLAPGPLQGFERAILREYLQFKILQVLFESDHAAQLSFLGGTALRIVYDNTRFSDDTDLDNFGLS
jgi:hypothetical protein